MARILVVEDEPAIAMVLRELLTEEGYEVQVAADGQAAVQLLSATPCPDLVITDLRLPYLSGAGIIEMMRRCPRLCSIPAVVATGSLLEELPPRQSYQALIQKPFDLSFVLQVVRDVLGSVAVT